MKAICIGLLAGLAAAGCEERRRTVNITFGENLEGLSGFNCVQDGVDPPTPLVARAVDTGGGLRPVFLVVDLLELGNGIPSCRPAQILSWCGTHECRASRGRRVVQELDLSGIVPSAPDVFEQVLGRLMDLDGERIFSDLPEGALILRVVGTVQPEAETLATEADGDYVPFDPSQLLGVAYSCPVVLSAASGQLFLGFDALNTQCEQGVIIASGAF